MHPEYQELLAHRDGDGSADTARHVETCEVCRSTVEELQAASTALKKLPSIPPPKNAWDQLRRRVSGQRRTTFHSRLALAAAAVVAASAAVFFAPFGPVGESPVESDVVDTRMVIEQLSGASRELETVLRESSLQTRVLSPRRAAMIVELEDRIALVDSAISQHTEDEPGERAVALWSDRVELLDALVTVRGGGPDPGGVTYAVNKN
jgi:hypothetical protein